MGNAASGMANCLCANDGCAVTGRGKVKKRRCAGVWHCSRGCKTQHRQSPRNPNGPQEGADDIGPAYPCPICLVNEDDHGKRALCYACGQLYCGDCNVAERMGRVENCPTCRAPFAVSAEVRVERLLGLVARSPGRHTPVAQFNLGVMYANGTGVSQSYTEAVPWYRLAADKGHAKGQVNLGCMYEDGAGVPQDYTEAVRWYRLAADQGLAIGQCNLGLMYEQGTGVPRDYTEAARWYRLAADQGHAGGQFNLGVMYKHGNGVAQDHAEAVRLYRLAADRGHAAGQCSLGVMYEDGTGVPQDQTEAARLFRVAADQGLAAGQCSLGVMYQNGAGVSKDFTEAVRWWRLAADQGLATGQHNLGCMLLTGKGAPKDINEAVRLLTLASDQGFQPAEDLLGKVTARFPAGTQVRIVGLVAAAHLNGRLGIAVQPPMPLTAGRILLRIEGQINVMLVSWANIGPDVAGGAR